jgi:hemerythrin-like domain-containing protein
MNPLETLSNEHGLIRQFLDNLTLSAQKIEEGQYPSRAFFEIAIEFARTFADKHHHFKEEHVLFVRLAEKKKGEVDAQLESLRYQHERGREHITAIANALDGYVERDPVKVTTMLESVAAYVSLLRHHIHVEDHIFYPLAKNMLAKNEMQVLEVEFDKQRNEQGGGTFERCHKQVVDMGSILTHLQAKG